jgi:hypothetical protein
MDNLMRIQWLSLMHRIESKAIWLLAISLLLLAVSGCSSEQERDDKDIIIPVTPNHVGVLTSQPPCTPTDQDNYVWRPARLQLVQPCVRAVGTVVELGSAEADGDAHIALQLDATYQELLTAGNKFVEGYLVIEAVCEFTPPLIEALRTCAADPDPYHDAFPHVGDHIWVEGRYVLDLGHHAWAELHPLYRWGPATP